MIPEFKPAYNLKRIQDREIIKEFEKKFLDWYAINKKDVLDWFVFLGAINVNDVNYSITNKDLFEELQNKWSALQNLRRLRQLASEYDKESFEALIANEIKSEPTQPTQSIQPKPTLTAKDEVECNDFWDKIGDEIIDN